MRAVQPGHPDLAAGLHQQPRDDGAAADEEPRLPDGRVKLTNSIQAFLQIVPLAINTLQEGNAPRS